jgi:hypothetical protein
MKTFEKYDDDDSDDSMNELNVYWEINHENIVRYFDHFNARSGGENHTFLIIEYCEVSKKIIL